MFKITIKGELSFNELLEMVKIIGAEKIGVIEDERLNDSVLSSKLDEVLRLDEVIRDWFNSEVIITDNNNDKTLCHELFSDFKNWCNISDLGKLYNKKGHKVSHITFIKALRIIYPNYKQFRIHNRVTRRS